MSLKGLNLRIKKPYKVMGGMILVASLLGTSYGYWADTLGIGMTIEVLKLEIDTEADPANIDPVEGSEGACNASKSYFDPKVVVGVNLPGTYQIESYDVQICIPGKDPIKHVVHKGNCSTTLIDIVKRPKLLGGGKSIKYIKEGKERNGVELSIEMESIGHIGNTLAAEGAQGNPGCYVNIIITYRHLETGMVSTGEIHAGIKRGGGSTLEEIPIEMDIEMDDAQGEANSEIADEVKEETEEDMDSEVIEDEESIDGAIGGTEENVDDEATEEERADIVDEVIADEEVTENEEKVNADQIIENKEKIDGEQKTEGSGVGTEVQE